MLLRNISVQDLSLLLNIRFSDNLIGFFFSLAEYDSSAVPTSIEVNDIRYYRVTSVIWAVNGQMLDGFRRFHLSALDEVNVFSV